MKKTKTQKKESAAAPQYVLVLRTCDADLKSYNRFQWPAKGPVKAPDWNPKPDCGGGLHGLLWGEGDGSLLNWDDGAKWLVVRVLKSDIVEILNPPGKVKFPSGEVVFCGTRHGATEYLLTAPEGRGARWACAGAAIGPSASGQSTSGYKGQSTSGASGQSTSGYKGQSTSGASGQSTSGDYGQSTSGDYGQSTSGYKGQSTSGQHGISWAKQYGYVRAAEKGAVVVTWWDEKAGRYRLTVGYVGEGRIEAGKFYTADDNGKIIPAPHIDAAALAAAKAKEAAK